MNRLVVVGVCAALQAGCAAAWPTLDLKALPTAERYPGARLVTLLEEHVADFTADGRDGQPGLRLTTRVRQAVLRAGEVPPVHAWYSRSFSRIESIRGRIVQPDGTSKPLDLTRQWDVPASGGSELFNDYRVLRVPVPPLPVGGVFEYEIVEVHDDIKPWVFTQSFADDQPAEVVRVVATAPKGWQVRWATWAPAGAEQLEPVVEPGERTRWTWERRAQAALLPEPSSPPDWARAPLLAVRLEKWTIGGISGEALATPEALSRWLAGEYERRAAPSSELVATVKEVLATVADTPEAKARALYEYACRRVQYCAIEAGYG